MAITTDIAALQAALAAEGATAVPPRDPDVAYSGGGDIGQWSDVWDEINRRAAKVVADTEAVTGKFGPAITTEIKTFLGITLQMISTYINNLQTQLWDGINFMGETVQHNVTALDDQIQLLDAQTGRLVGDNYELREVILPALFGQLAQLRQDIAVTKLQTEAELQDWTRTDVVIPLLQTIYAQDEELRQNALLLAQQQFQYTDQKHAEQTWERVAAVLLLQNQLNVIETEFDECVNDMCQTMGPKTDLGKFLKALQIAGSVALLAELANLDRDGIDSLLQGLVHVAGGVIDDIGSIFTGGETVGEALGGAIGL